MSGGKGDHLEAFAERNGLGYLAIDYSGHDLSSGELEHQSPRNWHVQVLEAIDRLTEGPLVLIGSSLGGWMASLAARDRPDRVIGMLGIAAAVDASRRLRANRHVVDPDKLGREGRIHVVDPTGEFDYWLGRAYFEPAPEIEILSTPWQPRIPVTLLHGTKDWIVPPDWGRKLADHIGPDCRFVPFEGGDHRLSDTASLALITGELSALIARSGHRTSLMRPAAA